MQGPQACLLPGVGLLLKTQSFLHIYTSSRHVHLSPDTLTTQSTGSSALLGNGPPTLGRQRAGEVEGAGSVSGPSPPVHPDTGRPALQASSPHALSSLSQGSGPRVPLPGQCQDRWKPHADPPSRASATGRQLRLWLLPAQALLPFHPAPARPGPLGVRAPPGSVGIAATGHCRHGNGFPPPADCSFNSTAQFRLVPPTSSPAALQGNTSLPTPCLLSKLCCFLTPQATPLEPLLRANTRLSRCERNVISTGPRHGAQRSRPGGSRKQRVPGAPVPWGRRAPCFPAPPLRPGLTQDNHGSGGDHTQRRREWQARHVRHRTPASFPFAPGNT